MKIYFSSAADCLRGLCGQAEVLALPGGAAQLLRQRGRLPVGVVQPGGQLGPLVADLAQLALQQARLAPQVARAPRQLVVVALELGMELILLMQQLPESELLCSHLFTVRFVVEDLLIKLLYLTSLLLDHSL